MAEKFYTPVEQASANWTGASKGFKSNNVFGDIAEGFGDLIKMGTTAADNYNQGMIKEEAKDATTKLYKDYGNDAAVATNAGVSGNFTPPEIQKGADQLKLLQQAAKNGTLKDSSFWAQAELISRQLKSRYPGYWEQIDNTMSEMVGRKPAQALFAELQQERTKTDPAAKAHENALEAARSSGFPEVFAREASGNPMTTEEINSLVASRNAIKYKQDYDGKEYSNRKSKNELTESDVALAARKDATTMLTSLLNSASTPMYKNVQEYQTLADQIQSIKASGRAIPKDLQAKITTVASSIDQQVNGIMNQMLVKYGQDMSGEKLSSELKFLGDWAKNYTNLVQQGDKYVGAWNTAILKSSQDADTFEFLQSNDVFRKSYALTQAIGQQAYSTWMSRNMGSKAFTDLELAVDGAMTNDMLFSGSSIVDTTKKMQEAGVRNTAVYGNQINSQMNSIVDKDIPPEFKANSINALYGGRSLDFLNILPKEERLPRYLQMSAPVIIKTVKGLYDAGQISQQDMQKHVDWVTKNAIDLIHDQAAEINKISTDRKGLQVIYNPDTGKLEPQKVAYNPDLKTKAGKFIARVGENFLSSQAKFSVDYANSILDRVKKVVETIEGDPDKEIQDILDKSGIEFGVGNLDKTQQEPSGLEPAVRATENEGQSIWEGFGILGDAKKYEAADPAAKAYADAIKMIFGSPPGGENTTGNPQ